VTGALAVEAPQHSAAFRRRRFLNWFPLGLTYATFYMGRYNFNVVKHDLGATYHLDKTQVGLIATAGFWTYAAAVLFNGPLADRIGGKRAILLGAAGAAVLNLIIGLMFLNGWQSGVLAGMCLLYAANSYFQSFGALSVVKVNAPWFHVRERGVFGGMFGIMISLGYSLALGVGGVVLARAGLPFVFLVPAAAIGVMFVLVSTFVKDTPAHAGFENFETADAAATDDEPSRLRDVLAIVLGNPVIRRIAAAEFCTGFVRQGLLLYFFEYLHEVAHVKSGSSVEWWAGNGPTIGGILGGLLCGWLSDRVFDSRRPPVAFIFYLGQIASLIALGRTQDPVIAAFLVGLCCLWIFGVHGMLSGTASMDFGGRKAAASAAGLLDGIQYVASGFTGFGLGWIIKTWGWGVWTWALVPFSCCGALIMSTLWNEKPQQARARPFEPVVQSVES
jgi:OPA family glycerol-3-phosphate transporter-like MFS transporter